MIYEDKDGITKVNVRFIDENIWLTQNHIASIYKTTQQNISSRIKNIYEDGELQDISTHKNFLLVQKEGNRKVKKYIIKLLNYLKNINGKLIRMSFSDTDKTADDSLTKDLENLYG